MTMNQRMLVIWNKKKEVWSGVAIVDIKFVQYVIQCSITMLHVTHEESVGEAEPWLAHHAHCAF